MLVKSSFQQCGACGEGALVTTRGVCEVEHHGEKGKIIQKSHTCDSCGAILFDEADVRENRRAWLRFKKQVDMIPLGFEIAAMRMAANLTQKAAGALFGGGPVAFSKYENDDLVPDDAMINLLKLAIVYPDTVTRLAEIKQKPILKQIFQNKKISVRSDDCYGNSFKLSNFPDFDTSNLNMVLTKSNLKISTGLEKQWTMH